MSLVTALTPSHYSPHSQMSPPGGCRHGDMSPRHRSCTSHPQWSLWWWWHSPHSGDRWPGAGWGWSVVTNVWCVLTPAPALMLCYRLVPDECGSQCSVSALVWLRSPVCECECGQSCGPGPNTETSPSSQWIGSRSTPKLAHSALTSVHQVGHWDSRDR